MTILPGTPVNHLTKVILPLNIAFLTQLTIILFISKEKYTDDIDADTLVSAMRILKQM